MLVMPGVLKRFSEIFLRQGFQCYLVGGAIRDMLIGRRLTDFDIATDALPEQVQDMFRRVIPTGIKHGTVTVLFRGTRFEVTTFRIEREYLDGRRPDSVVFSPSIEEDLKRRDFTINAMAYDLAARRLLDPHGGREDLRRKVLRAIGVPLERFLEDGLRPLRACRFAAQFGFTIEPETFAAIPLSLDTVRKVSAERIREELVRLLAAPAPSIGFRLMRSSGLLALLLPELEAGAGVEQRDLHCFDVLEHSLRSCDAAPPGNFVVRLAALLHDIGKPQSLERSESGDLKFYGHELASAQAAEGLLRRLRFSNEVIRRTCHLVRHHMFNYTDQWSDAAVRRLVSRVGQENLPDLLALRRADQIGTCGDTAPSPSLIAFERRLEQVLAAGQAFSLKDLAVDGDELMAALDLPPGPKIGALLAQLLDSVLADPAMNEKEKLLEIARRFYEQRLAQG
jgi:poly(A) polymerase/tRNA nucleotidyltransferase (CCA-adding enzyme)